MMAFVWFKLFSVISIILIDVAKYWVGGNPGWDHVIVAAFVGFLIATLIDDIPITNGMEKVGGE